VTFFLSTWAAQGGMIYWSMPSGRRVMLIHADEQLALACGQALLRRSDETDAVVTTAFEVSRQMLAGALTEALAADGHSDVHLAFPDDPSYIEVLNGLLQPPAQPI
jgi:hypothetical protein